MPKQAMLMVLMLRQQRVSRGWKLTDGKTAKMVHDLLENVKGCRCAA